MIAARQMVPADDGAKLIAGHITELRELHDRLIRAGLYDYAAKLDVARSALAQVGLDLRRECRETFVALRQGKDVPR